MRRAILASLGIAGCGPSVDDPSGEGEGSAEGTSDDSDGSTSTASTTNPSTSVGSSATTEMSTTTATVTSAESGDTGEVPWSCGAPIPPEVVPPECADPTPILQVGADGNEVPTGLETCADGRVHRIEATACELGPMPAGDCVPEESAGGCTSDAECTDAPNGFCNVQGGFKGVPGCGCEYACTTDADCAEDQLCMCDGTRSRCISAACHTDDECGGFTCQLGADPNVCSADAKYFACGSPADECSAASGTCDDVACEVCSWSADDCTWACRYDEDVCSDCGRPYLVDGRARLAAATVRDDWSSTIATTDERRDVDVERTIAAHWLRNALAEHASVAAFARYALDLLALAAPASLVADATRAMADEIEHARLCFGLAARHGARAHGPGVLPSDGALGDRSALEILDDVVREACIGETLAALDAIESLAHARDPEVRVVLARIAADELRHAQLGWRHLQWQLGQADAKTRETILELVERAIADAAMAPIVGASREDLRAFGVLDTETRARARIMGILEVVTPCAAALLAAAPIRRVAVA